MMNLESLKESFLSSRRFVLLGFFVGLLYSLTFCFLGELDVLHYYILSIGLLVIPIIIWSVYSLAASVGFSISVSLTSFGLSIFTPLQCIPNDYGGLIFIFATVLILSTQLFGLIFKIFKQK